ARPRDRKRPVGGAGYWRRDQGREPLRHLLGFGRRCAADCGRDERPRPRLCVPAQGHAAAPRRGLMRAPRGLSAEEQAAWARLARTVEPLHPSPHPPPEDDHSKRGGGPASPKPPPPPRRAAAKPSLPTAEDRPRAAARPIHDSGGLDSSWERKLKVAKIEPDFTLDLHGHSLDAAHDRLDRGLSQAKAMGARLVLVITGKQR